MKIGKILSRVLFSKVLVFITGMFLYTKPLVSQPVFSINERCFIDLLLHYVPTSDDMKALLYDQADKADRVDQIAINHISQKLVQKLDIKLDQTTHIPLFDAYSRLRDTIPYLPCVDLPTPVQKLTHMGKKIDCVSLYIKRDDLTGSLDSQNKRRFGGNKPRKLSFILADALAKGAKSVLTFGCAGSNHVVATASCAAAYDLPCIAMLQPQPNSQVVRRNLRLMAQYGTQIIWSQNRTERDKNVIFTYLKNKELGAGYPYPIPTGGSSPLGALGFVNAAYELKKQIIDGLMPEPDLIYVATGSCGTAAGLIVGCALAQLKTRVIAVATSPEDFPGQYSQGIAALCNNTIALLRSHDDIIPALSWDPENIQTWSVNTGFSGTQYGLFTPEGVAAVSLIRETETITLDGVYTGKACAALCQDGMNGDLKNKVVLFWNTFCGNPLELGLDQTNTLNNKHVLPKEAYAFFTDPVQPLDQK